MQLETFTGHIVIRLVDEVIEPRNTSAAAGLRDTSPERFNA